MRSELAGAVDVGTVYEEHIGLLVGTAIGRYHLSDVDAQALAHDVFLAFVLKAHEIRDTRAWLLSAMCNASKYFLRCQARYVPLSAEHVAEPDPRLEDVREALPDQLAGREAFSCLTMRCQLALRLRYWEGYTVPEIAESLQTTPKYAAKLVARCLKQAHGRYGSPA